MNRRAFVAGILSALFAPPVPRLPAPVRPSWEPVPDATPHPEHVPAKRRAAYRWSDVELRIGDIVIHGSFRL